MLKSNRIMPIDRDKESINKCSFQRTPADVSDTGDSVNMSDGAGFDLIQAWLLYMFVRIW